MRGRKVVLLLIIVMLVFTMSTAFAISFSDLTEEHWAYKYITTLTDDGVINGYTDGTFRPSGKIKRAEFLKLITVAALGEDEINKIIVPEDFYLKEKWYGKYVFWAEQNSMLLDIFTEEDWESYINRLEMVKILYTYSDYMGLFEENLFDEDDIKNEIIEESTEEHDVDDKEEVEYKAMAEALNNMGYKSIKYMETSREEINEIINDFSEDKKEEFFLKMNEILEIKDIENVEKSQALYNDIETLSEIEATMLKFVSNLKFITGYEDGSFKPYKFMSRAEVATIIYRFNQKK